MAGRRRIGRRGDDGRIRPVVPVERADRIYTAARARYAVAQTPLEGFAVSVDYVRASAAAAERAGVEHAGAELEDAARDNFARGDRLTKALKEQGRIR